MSEVDLAYLRTQGYLFFREIEGRGLCGVCRMVFTVGLFYGLENDSYEGRYCYETFAEAVVALATWDGKADPDDYWIKHKGGIGEYPNPNYQKV